MPSQGHLPGSIYGWRSHTHPSIQLPVSFISPLTHFARVRNRSIQSLRYYHRCLNIPKLVDVRFTAVPSTMTLARMIRLHKVPDRPRLLDYGLREMEERDVPQVADLFARYMQRFDMVPIFTEEEIRHQFLSGLGEGPRGPDSWKTKREGQVVWTYVVEVSEYITPTGKKATDRCADLM